MKKQDLKIDIESIEQEIANLLDMKARKEEQLQSLCSHPELEKSGGYSNCMCDGSNYVHDPFFYVCRKCGKCWNLYQCDVSLDERVIIDNAEYDKWLKDYMQKMVKENRERMGK